MGQHLGSKVFVGMALAVVAALGMTQPGASAESASAPTPGMLPSTACPVAPEQPAQGGAQSIPQDPCEPPDPCGDDSDGDGIPDCSDECPFDASNTCNDPTEPPTSTPPTSEPPTTPPTTVPPTTGTPTPAPSPTTAQIPAHVAVPGCTNGCVYQREVALRITGTTLRGTVSSPAAGCRTGATVTVWRVHKRADRRLVVVSARSNGAFATKRPAKAGTYYVTVTSPEQPLCGTARSRKVTVRR